jgi:diphosphomevalonate decarboxylase
MSTKYLDKNQYQIADASIEVSCPSNIALVKYWGKYDGQIPANPSISYSLKHCKTITKIEFLAHQDFEVELYLNEQRHDEFAKKLEKYFRSIAPYLGFVLQGKYIIHTHNTFPHSSGIASSASGFGAIAKALVGLAEQFSQPLAEDFKQEKSSFLARLGSGSACRSLYNGLVVWGETEVMANSSNLYAVPYPEADVHPVFKQFNDWVLLIHEGEKMVSSSFGHSLMNGNPYAEKRFTEAHKNMQHLKHILKSGDLQAFGQLLEHEALTLHAMMMMSAPAFILMKPQTLNAIDKIWEYRKFTNNPLYFTLDAGANLHLLFPKNNKEAEIMEFIEAELRPFTQKGNIVKDEVAF